MFKVLIAAVALAAPVYGLGEILLTNTVTNAAGVTSTVGTTTLLSSTAALGLFSVVGIAKAIGIGLLASPLRLPSLHLSSCQR